MNFLKKTIPVLLVCSLAACAQDYLATGLPQLQGQPIARATHYLGQPTEQKKDDGATVYSWVNDQTGTFDVPHDEPYPVVAGNNGHPIVTYTGSTSAGIADSYHWHCRLDITAEKGVITHTSYEGDTAGCKKFSDALKPLAPAKN